MTTDEAADPTVEAAAALMRQAVPLFRQWRVGIWESADEIDAALARLGRPVLRLVRDLIEAQQAADEAAG